MSISTSGGNEELSEEDKKIIHENLTTNVYNEMFKIAASQLPF